MKKCTIALLILLSNIFFSQQFSQDDLRNSIPILLNDGNKAEAEKRLQLLLKKFPSRSTYLFAAETYVQLGKREYARNFWYRDINNLENEYPELEQYFFKYSLYHELNELYEKVLRLSPRNLYIRLKLLRVYRSLNRINDFFKTIKYILENRDDFPTILINEIHAVCEEQGTNAEENLIFFANNNSYSKRVRMVFAEALAKIYLSTRKYDKLLEIYKNLVANNFYTGQQIEDVLKKIAFIPGEQRVGSFLKHLRKVYKNHYAVLKFTAEYFYLKKEYNESLKIAARAVNLFSSEQKNPFILLAVKIYIKLGKLREAQNYLNLLSSQFLDKKKLYTGILKMIQGNYADARNLFLDTNDVKKYYYLIHIHLFENKMDEAEKTLNKWLTENLSNIPQEGFEFFLIFNHLKTDKKLLNGYVSFMKEYIAHNLEKAETLISKLRNSPLYSYLVILLTKLYENSGNWIKIELILKNVIKENNFFGEKALFLLGKLYIKKMNRKSEGEKLLYKLLENFPDTVFKGKISLLLSQE